MDKYLPVFNLGDSPVDYLYGGLAPVTILPRRWSFVPHPIALNACANDPQLFVDFGPRSLSDYRLFYRSRGQKHLNITSTVDAVTGYGRLSAHLIDEYLLNKDVNLNISPSGYWHEQGLSAGIAELMSKYRAANVPPEKKFEPQYNPRRAWSRPSNPITLPTRWSIGVTIPPELAKVPSPRVLLMTMWEASEIPQRKNYMLTGEEQNKPELWYNDPNAWPEWINARTSILTVPSEDMKQVFLRAITETGEHINLEPVVVPLGIDPAFTFIPRAEHDTMKIVMWGELSGRKPALETIIEVIMPVLQDYSDWHLTVKTRGTTSISAAAISHPNITIVNADYTPQQMVELAQGADVGLCISRYEGWGLVSREMMATGLPVIMTDNSGHAIDADPDYNYPVGSTGMSDTWRMSAEWHEPDWEQARVALAKEYADWKARKGAQSAMGARAAAWIRGRRNYKMMADQLIGLIDDFESRKR